MAMTIIAETISLDVAIMSAAALFDNTATTYFFNDFFLLIFPSGSADETAQPAVLIRLAVDGEPTPRYPAEAALPASSWVAGGNFSMPGGTSRPVAFFQPVTFFSSPGPTSPPHR